MEAAKISPCKWANIVRAEKPTTITYGEYGPYQLRQVIEASGIPLRHVLTMDGIDSGSDAMSAQLLAKAVDGGIIALLGKRGTGKTQLAVSVLLDFIETRKRVTYCKAADLFREIRSQMQNGGEAALVNKLASVALLVIDEAHERAESDFENRTLVNIVDRRYDAIKPLIFIANQTRQEFATNMGDSIVSRMHEVGDVIEMNGPSFRRKA
jgi:DNA replication protein DnaC